MKRLILTIAIVFLSASLYAQEHMTFKGHSMGCTVSEMVDNLKKDGYKVLDESIECSALKGVFSGSEATVYLYPNKIGNLNKAVVSYDMSIYQWRQIKAHMENLETGLTKKYGNPSNSTKEFDNLYTDGSGREISGFRRGTNNYSLLWELEKGYILLMLSATNTTPTLVILSYIDGINSAVDEEQAYEDL